MKERRTRCSRDGAYSEQRTARTNHGGARTTARCSELIRANGGVVLQAGSFWRRAQAVQARRRQNASTNRCGTRRAKERRQRNAPRAARITRKERAAQRHARNANGSRRARRGAHRRRRAALQKIKNRTRARVARWRNRSVRAVRNGAA